MLQFIIQSDLERFRVRTVSIRQRNYKPNFKRDLTLNLITSHAIFSDLFKMHIHPTGGSLKVRKLAPVGGEGIQLLSNHFL